MLVHCLIFGLVINNVVSVNITSEMEKHGVVPDVIDKSPDSVLIVKYDDKEVNLGNELTPFGVKATPYVKLIGDSDKYYTLAMVDPDAPSREDPKFRNVKHWLVVNIKGTDLESGEVIAEYVGSGPPKGTGLHRYIFLLFEQPGKIAFEEPFSAANSRANRLSFDLTGFTKRYNLGQPIAGNFYMAQWDEYVEIRNKGISN